jgi:hypothetical protein
MEKYNIFENHSNLVIDGLCKLIYSQTYLVMSESLKTKMLTPNLDFVDIKAQTIYEHLFPKYEFRVIDKQIHK